MIIPTHKLQVSGKALQADSTINIREHRANARHRRIIADYKAAHPLCERCLGQHGMLTAMDQVHHIKPIADGGVSEPYNLMSLCEGCHVTIDELSQGEQRAIKEASAGG
jgi:5-methylcytosine-specific restriction endonuclease McrA